jgi:small GTP-binding protein
MIRAQILNDIMMQIELLDSIDFVKPLTVCSKILMIEKMTKESLLGLSGDLISLIHSITDDDGFITYRDIFIRWDRVGLTFALFKVDVIDNVSMKINDIDLSEIKIPSDIINVKLRSFKSMREYYSYLMTNYFKKKVSKELIHEIYYPIFKIALVGPSGCGKTCLMTRIMKNSFAHCGPTTGIDRQNDESLWVWDCAGQERYRSMWANYIRNSNLILFCYDFTDSISKELEFFKQYIPDDKPVLLVITKSDLLKLKLNDYEMIKSLVKNCGLCGFIITSALLGYNTRNIRNILSIRAHVNFELKTEGKVNKFNYTTLTTNDREYLKTKPSNCVCL